jgi:hypothetical protein
MAATDLADHLVGRACRSGRRTRSSARLVLRLEREGRTLQDLTAEEWSEVHPSLGPMHSEGPSTSDLSSDDAKAKAVRDRRPSLSS